MEEGRSHRWIDLRPAAGLPIHRIVRFRLHDLPWAALAKAKHTPKNKTRPQHTSSAIAHTQTHTQRDSSAIFVCFPSRCYLLRSFQSRSFGRGPRGVFDALACDASAVALCVFKCGTKGGPKCLALLRSCVLGYGATHTFERSSLSAKETLHRHVLASCGIDPHHFSCKYRSIT